jgi:hypothetical protein
MDFQIEFEREEEASPSSKIVKQNSSHAAIASCVLVSMGRSQCVRLAPL